MTRINALILLIAICWQSVAAQSLAQDTLKDDRTQFFRFVESPIGQATVAGLTLTAGGLFVKSQDDKFRTKRTEYLPVPEHSHDYYLQLVPVAIMLGMKSLGVEGESTWSQMLVADAAAFVIMCGTVEGLKHTADEWRPDGSDEHSFPSGHTATAFMTATMLHHEYGNRYPWLSVVGYGLATTTGFLRVNDNRHWLGDVLTGAGIGIVSTELGYVVSDLIFHRPILKDAEYFRNLGKGYCPSFLGFYFSYDCAFKSYDGCGGMRFKLGTGCSLGMEGAWFPIPYLGVGGKATFSDLKFFADDVPQSQPIRYMTAQAGLYNSSPFSSRLSLDLKILAGYGRYEGLDVNDAQNNITHFDKHGGFAFTTGVAFTWRASRGLSYRVFADVNNMPRQSSEADRLSVSSFGAQAVVNF